MKATIDIPEPALGDLKMRFDRAGAPASGVPVQFFASWTPDGVPMFRFVSVPARPFPSPLGSGTRSRGVGMRREKPAWAGLAASHIHVKPGMSHDWAAIQKRIEEGLAAEIAERERMILKENK